MVDPKTLLNRKELADALDERYPTIQAWERRKFVAPARHDGRDVGYTLLGAVHVAIFAELAREKTTELKLQSAQAADLVAQFRNKMEKLQGKVEGRLQIFGVVPDGGVAPAIAFGQKELAALLEYFSDCVVAGHMLDPPHTPVTRVSLVNLTMAVGRAQEGFLRKAGVLEEVDRQAEQVEQDRFDRTPSTAYGEQLPAVLVGWLGDQRAALEALPPTKRSMWAEDCQQRGCGTVAQHIVADLRRRDPKAAGFLDQDTEERLVRAATAMLRSIFTAQGLGKGFRLEARQAEPFPPRKVIERRREVDE